MFGLIKIAKLLNCLEKFYLWSYSSHNITSKCYVFNATALLKQQINYLSDENTSIVSDSDSSVLDWDEAELDDATKVDINTKDQGG